MADEKKSGKDRTKIRRCRLAILTIALLFCALLCVAIAYRFSALFSIPHPIRAVEITTNGTLDNTFVGKVLGLEKANDLGSLDVRQLRSRLLKVSQVRDVRIDRVYPDRLKVRIDEYAPVFKIPYDEKGFCFMASDGSIFESLSIGDEELRALPLLRGIDLTGRAKNVLPFGKELSHFWSASRQFSPDLVRQWRAVYVDEKAFDLAGKLDCIEIQSASIKHLLIDPTASQRQLEELVYILEEANRKHLLPLLKVDLTVENHAFVKPMR